MATALRAKCHGMEAAHRNRPAAAFRTPLSPAAHTPTFKRRSMGNGAFFGTAAAAATCSACHAHSGRTRPHRQSTAPQPPSQQRGARKIQHQLQRRQHGHRRRDRCQPARSPLRAHEARHAPPPAHLSAEHRRSQCRSNSGEITTCAARYNRRRSAARASPSTPARDAASCTNASIARLNGGPRASAPAGTAGTPEAAAAPACRPLAISATTAAAATESAASVPALEGAALRRSLYMRSEDDTTSSRTGPGGRADAATTAGGAAPTEPPIAADCAVPAADPPLVGSGGGATGVACGAGAASIAASGAARARGGRGGGAEAAAGRSAVFVSSAPP